MNFAQAAVTPNMTLTTNGMAAYDKTGSKLLDLFYNIGSARNNPGIAKTFMGAFGENKLLATKCLFWARDVRGGAGERKVFRDLIQTMELVDPEAVVKNIHLIAEYGRADDLLELQTPMCRREALKLFAEKIRQGEGLFCKWAPRKGPDAVALTKTLGVSPKQYRKMIVAGSKTVEQQMCANDWNNIEYGKLPSIAAARYQKAFGRHDEAGYAAYKEALVSGEAKINASTIFPHDVVKSAMSGDPAVANAQWEALPNYVGDHKILPISDVSDSMTCSAGGGSTRCLDVSVALGLYLASKNTGVFKDLICTFHTTPELFKVEGDLAVKARQLYDAPWGGSTNFAATFDLILRKAKENNVAREDMPEVLVCLSDMGFNQAQGNMSGFTAIQMAKQKYIDANYKLPILVMWNLNSDQNGQPACASENGVIMISGFSPYIMKAVLACDFDKITPEAMMLEVLNSPRYEAITV